MIIAFSELEQWEQEAMAKRLKGRKHKLIFIDGKLSKKNVSKARQAEALCPFIYSELDARTLAGLPRLKLISTMSTGYDHIDLKACRKRGIKVCNVPTYGENTVAEHTFALILCLSRKIKPSMEKVCKVDFDLKGLRGTDLKGKTLGIVGTGNIGRHVARIAYGFEMNVLAYDIRRNAEVAEKYGGRYVGLPELFRKSDIITFHAPYNRQTHHMLNMNSVKKLKRGALVINTARGGLIETQALVYGLDRGILGGVGLDVLEGEAEIREEKELLTAGYDKERLKTLVCNHILMARENVIITPHNAFNSTEALTRILETTVKNIESYGKGRTINEVKKRSERQGQPPAIFSRYLTPIPSIMPANCMADIHGSVSLCSSGIRSEPAM